MFSSFIHFEALQLDRSGLGLRSQSFLQSPAAARPANNCWLSRASGDVWWMSLYESACSPAERLSRGNVGGRSSILHPLSLSLSLLLASTFSSFCSKQPSATATSMPANLSSSPPSPMQQQLHEPADEEMMLQPGAPRFSSDEERGPRPALLPGKSSWVRAREFVPCDGGCMQDVWVCFPIAPAPSSQHLQQQPQVQPPPPDSASPPSPLPPMPATPNLNRISSRASPPPCSSQQQQQQFVGAAAEARRAIAEATSEAEVLLCSKLQWLQSFQVGTVNPYVEVSSNQKASASRRGERRQRGGSVERERSSTTLELSRVYAASCMLLCVVCPCVHARFLLPGPDARVPTLDWNGIVGRLQRIRCHGASASSPKRYAVALP